MQFVLESAGRRVDSHWRLEPLLSSDRWTLVRIAPGIIWHWARLPDTLSERAFSSILSTMVDMGLLMGAE